MADVNTPASAPKAMSSRLLTMKFMQRAAASPPSPSTPEPPSKRRKRDVGSPPTRFDVDALADNRAIQKALADEEAKRQTALEKQAAELGDTRWVLSFEDNHDLVSSTPLALRIVQTGYATLDSYSPHQILSADEDAEYKPVVVGRRSFGKFNRVLENQLDPSIEDSSDSDEDEDDEDDVSNNSDRDSDSPTNDLIKASREEAAQRAKKERKAKKKAEKSKEQELARQRRRKEVNINGITSLSGSKGPAGGASQSKGPCFNCGGPHIKATCPELGDREEMKCYRCGGPHMKSSCPEIKRGHLGGDDGPPRKSFRAR